MQTKLIALGGRAAFIYLGFLTLLNWYQSLSFRQNDKQTYIGFSHHMTPL